MTNEQMVEQIQGGADLIEELYRRNKGLLSWAANKYAGRCEYDDLMQEAYIALHDAAHQYEPDKGASFSGYAARRIMWRLQRYINGTALIKVPINKLEKLQRYKKVTGYAEMMDGRIMGDAEACKVLGVPAHELEEIKAADVSAVSLSSPIGDDAELLELLPDDADGIEAAEDRLQREQLKAAIWAEVDKLPRNQSRVLRMRYQKGMTYKEINEKYKTNSHAMHDKALRELRKPSHARNLKPFADSVTYSRAIKGTGIEMFNRTWTSSTERVAIKQVEAGRRDMERLRS